MNQYTELPKEIENLDPVEKEKLQHEFESRCREFFEDQIRFIQAGIEENVKKASAAYFTSNNIPTPKKKKLPDITNMRLFFFDNDTFMPLGDFAYSVVGTPSQVAEMIAAKGEKFFKSYEARQSQNLRYRIFIDTYKMTPIEASRYFIPDDATPQERTQIRRRLKQHYRRMQKNVEKEQKGTKTAKRTPRQTPK